MTAHRHKDSRGLWTTTVADPALPSLAGFATAAALANAVQRIAVLEAAVAALSPTGNPGSGASQVGAFQVGAFR